MPGFADHPTADTPAAGFDARLQSTVRVLARIGRDFNPAVFTSSFSIEDCVLADLLAIHAPQVELVTLDTGRLPQETHDLIAAYVARGTVIRVLVPESGGVESCISRYGINGFRDSLQARRDCCNVRKVLPLGRALAGKRTWLTGLRRAQSADRQSLSLESFDAERGIHKFNPLLDWSDAAVQQYAKERDLPVHALYARGYTSIGCAPCTRAVAAGENVRAGRWWWEGETVKECGLHARPEQRVAGNEVKA